MNARRSFAPYEATEYEDPHMQGVDKLCELAGAASPGGEAFVDCDQIDSMPDVVFHIQGKAFPLSAQDYVLQVRLRSCCAAGWPSSSCACLVPRIWRGVQPLGCHGDCAALLACLRQ